MVDDLKVWTGRTADHVPVSATDSQRFRSPAGDLPPRVHVIGQKNHGKTTLVVELIEELGRRGLCVGSIKHCGHRHELDRPGSDSYRHRRAGAAPAAVLTPDQIAVHLPRQDGDRALFEALFRGCDLVLVEGDRERAITPGSGFKIEVWRAVVGGRPLAAERDDVAAVVTSDPLPGQPTWPRGDVSAVADRLLELVDLCCTPKAGGSRTGAPRTVMPFRRGSSRRRNAAR